MELLNSITQGYGFAWYSLMGIILLSGVCAQLSGIVVLKQRSYVADTLTHFIFPGVVGGLALSHTLELPRWFCVIFGSGVIAYVGVLFQNSLFKRLKLPFDSVAVLSLGGFLSFGLVLNSVLIKPVDVHSLLFGDILSLRLQDMVVLGLLNGLLFFFHAKYGKAIQAWLIDEDFAHVVGHPIKAIERWVPVLLTMTVLSGIFTVGGLMISSLLVFPAILARRHSLRFGVMFPISLLTGLLGLVAAYELDFPVGPTIVLMGFLAVLLQFLLLRRA